MHNVSNDDVFRVDDVNDIKNLLTVYDYVRRPQTILSLKSYNVCNSNIYLNGLLA